MPILLDLTTLRASPAYRPVVHQAVAALTAWQRGFLRYDAREPTP
ncbi:MAG: hypothetical protein ACYCV4_06550 [Dermatophilaceae bacterium]